MSPIAHVFELLVPSWWLWNLQEGELCWRSLGVGLRVALPQFPLSPDFLCVNENMLGQLPASASCYHVFSTIMDTIPLELQAKMNSSFGCFWPWCFIIATPPTHTLPPKGYQREDEGRQASDWSCQGSESVLSLECTGEWCLSLKHTSSLLF